MSATLSIGCKHFRNGLCANTKEIGLFCESNIDCNYKCIQLIKQEEECSRILRGEKITNFDKIKSMTVDEMAEFIEYLSVDWCEYCYLERNALNCEKYPCNYGIKQWLLKESEE